MIDALQEIIKAIVFFLTNFYDYVVNSITIFVDKIVASFVTFGNWIFDSIFGLAESVINSIDLSAITSSMSTGFGLLPPQVNYILHQIGFTTGFAILSTAFVIRMGINLIPSWATRF